MKALLSAPAITQNYLLMQPIQNSLHSGHAASLASVCQDRLAVHLEAPALRDTGREAPSPTTLGPAGRVPGGGPVLVVDPGGRDAGVQTAISP